MNRLSAFVVGCIAGAAIAVVPSCGGGAHCTVANCAGCCTMAGKCATGATAAECGQNGVMCVECTGVQGCSADGVCTADGNGGGDTGNGGGTLSNGGGTTGNGGGVSNGGGASNGGGGTHAGGGAGGTGGGTGLNTCGVNNCSDGCCVGSTCVRGAAQTNTQCGVGGFGCLMCAAGNDCVNGSCMGTVTCGPSNCAGCCSNNACVPIAQQGAGACGTGGNACAPCNADQTCTTGTCQTPATLGGPCTNSTQCSTLGAGALCKTMTSSGNATYSGGFCTVPCAGTEGDPCASGHGVCIGGGQSVLGFYGEGDLFCTPTCPQPGTLSNCRSGYACYGDTMGYCWLDPVPAFDGGGFDTKVGNACTSDTPCQNPPSPLFGYCVTAKDSTGANTGFTGGYCTADCSFDNTDTFCGPTGACFGFALDDGGTFSVCLRICPNPGGGHVTRTGYSCFTGTDVDGGTIGYVFPACDQPGDGCPQNYFCNASTGYCCDAGDCMN